MIYWLWALPCVAVVVHVLGRVHWQCSRTDLLRWLARSGVGVCVEELWASCGDTRLSVCVGLVVSFAVVPFPIVTALQPLQY